MPLGFCKGICMQWCPSGCQSHTWTGNCKVQRAELLWGEPCNSHFTTGKALPCCRKPEQGKSSHFASVDKRPYSALPCGESLPRLCKKHSQHRTNPAQALLNPLQNSMLMWKLGDAHPATRSFDAVHRRGGSRAKSHVSDLPEQWCSLPHAFIPALSFSCTLGINFLEPGRACLAVCLFTLLGQTARAIPVLGSQLHLHRHLSKWGVFCGALMQWFYLCNHIYSVFTSFLCQNALGFCLQIE